MSNIGQLSSTATDLPTLDLWCDALESGYGLACESDRDIFFDSHVQISNAGSLKIANVWMSPQTLQTLRRPQLSEESVMIKMIAEGNVAFERDGEQHSFGPGGLVVVDPAQPFREHVPAHAKLIVVSCPRDALQLRGYKYKFNHWIAPDMSLPDVRLVQDMIRLIASYTDEVADVMRARLGNQLLDLMDVIISEDLTQSAETARLRVKHFVAAELADVELDAAKIARGVNLSVGYINRLFAAEGGSLMRYVWNRRLDRARQMLLTPGRQRQSIESIGWRCGFVSPAHFSRLFKARYSSTPRDMRANARDA